MKLESSLLLSFLAVCLFSACSKTPDQPTPEPEEPVSDYTIMIYGCGGGDLDGEAVKMMSDCLSYGSTDEVKIAIEYNFSKGHQTKKPLPGTVRLAVPDSSFNFSSGPFARVEKFLNMLDSLSLAEVLTQPDKTPLDLSKKQNLTDFIDWAARIYPARNYILVLWNHGKGWKFNEDAATKGVILDDNNGSVLSLPSLVSAVKSSSVKKLKCIYNDACLMCGLENYCGYSDIADFALGSTSPASAIGGDYNMFLTLLNGLRVKEDSEFSAIMKKYCNYTINTWSSSKYGHDISFTDLSLMDSVACHIRTFVDTLMKVYPSDTAIDAGIRSTLAILKQGSRYFPTVDVDDLINKVGNATSNTFLMYYSINSPYLNGYQRAKYTVVSPVTAKMGYSSIGFSVTLLDKDSFQEQKEAYQATDFDKAAGWSRFLEINRQPIANNPVLVHQTR